MRHLDNGRALAVELLEQVHDLFSLAGMQTAGGFICQDQLWFGDDRSRDCHQLLLSAGELVRVEVFLGHDVKSVQNIRDDALAFR